MSNPFSYADKRVIVTGAATGFTAAMITGQVDFAALA
jgi:hypothetical protein